MSPASWMRLGIPLVALCLTLNEARAYYVCPDGYPSTTMGRRFSVSADGTAHHLATGLVWKRCAEGQTWDGTTCNGETKTYTWQEAFSRVNAVNASLSGTQNIGANDWRLPNINELRSIVERGCAGPSSSLGIFPRTPTLGFWSSSAIYALHGSAWIVDFNDGVTNYGNRTDTYAVRLVRSGQDYYNFDASAATVPNAPVLLKLIAGNRRMKVIFSAPAWNGGTDIDNYIASCTGGGSTSTGTGATSPIVVTSLVNHTSYTCRVRAHNSKGDGFESVPLVKVARPVANVATTTVILDDTE